MKIRLSLICFFISINLTNAQVEESQTGAWFMYFYNHQFSERQWGIQGDFQYRDWQGLGDMEQLMLRSGLTFTPKDSGVMFTLGYANITSGQFGDSDDTSNESRIYQEALIPQKLGNRFYLTHRFRYEQRFVENQDFRTRYRYNLFLNVPLNKKTLSEKAIYAALYNELFINGQTDIGDNRTVELFDRNRTYLGFGYVLNPKIKFQLGWMNQKTNNWGKGQWQVSMHHKF
ncbi:DUF2490 domain-containing protein [Ichthyenterobacterium sp. W332]|uniref:DUF2490 domain-containing protein n=1 Tax=Microcosmobacter mediterraneus TaxID=3075607 RepID=A0ABU2YP02_9FLAO|nr:DUF2490 domain-containing protein [Ichthyenterobacterium sp. W332]MDT0559424.1 DUF2490 domain-containing protein [Ichthyenterobacterium sp. W332]